MTTKFYITIDVKEELPKESYNGHFCYDVFGNMQKAYFHIPDNCWRCIKYSQKIGITYWLKEISLPDLWEVLQWHLVTLKIHIKIKTKTIKNKQEILSPEEWFKKKYPLDIFCTYGLYDDDNCSIWNDLILKKYAKYYHQSLLQQSIPTEEETEKRSIEFANWIREEGYLKNGTIQEGLLWYLNGTYNTTQELYKNFKAAINHLTKGEGK